jgi:hypothetical protein
VYYTAIIRYIRVSLLLDAKHISPFL